MQASTAEPSPGAAAAGSGPHTPAAAQQRPPASSPPDPPAEASHTVPAAAVSEAATPPPPPPVPARRLSFSPAHTTPVPRASPASISEPGSSHGQPALRPGAAALLEVRAGVAEAEGVLRQANQQRRQLFDLADRLLALERGGRREAERQLWEAWHQVWAGLRHARSALFCAAAVGPTQQRTCRLPILSH